MMFTHARSHQRMGVDECHQLLGTERLGRVAFSVGALPAVVPVVYHLAAGHVVFGVEEDALYAALSDAVVAFEVDHVDVAAQNGWTVLVVGRSRPEERLGGAGIEPKRIAVHTGPDRLIGISLDRLSGLRARPPIASLP
jgi:hypothetical protein